jgi:CDP-diacylglycerol--glycerol-3-phosphate 3-phosphatidyltransferase
MRASIKDLLKIGLIPDWLDKIFLGSVTPLINFLSHVGVHPNWITALGFVQNAAAAVFIYFGHFLVAGILVGTAGIFDFIDGKVASLSRKTTTFGAIFDSVIDRYSDIAIYLGIFLFALRRQMDLLAVISVVAMVGSVMTSYIKALGESHGVRFRAGALRRQERVTLIFAGLVLAFIHTGFERLFRPHALEDAVLRYLPFFPLSLILYFLALFSNITALQRFRELYRLTGENRPERR